MTCSQAAIPKKHQVGLKNGLLSLKLVPQDDKPVEPGFRIADGIFDGQFLHVHCRLPGNRFHQNRSPPEGNRHIPDQAADTGILEGEFLCSAAFFMCFRVGIFRLVIYYFFALYVDSRYFQ